MHVNSFLDAKLWFKLKNKKGISHTHVYTYYHGTIGKPRPDDSSLIFIYIKRQENIIINDNR